MEPHGHESSFGISSPAEFMNEIVLPEYRDFLDDNSSIRHALLTTIVVYHMYEWANGTKFTIDNFKQTYPDRESMAELFELARKLSNGFKHFKQTVDTQQQGGFSSAFGDGYIRPLMIHLEDGMEMSADRLLRRIVDFWKEQTVTGF